MEGSVFEQHTFDEHDEKWRNTERPLESQGEEAIAWMSERSVNQGWMMFHHGTY